MHRVACDMLAERRPKAAEVLEEAGPDALACLDFPAPHRKRLRTSNVQERANREIGRRPRAVQVLPSEKSLERLVGAVTCGTDESWSSSRYFSEARMRELGGGEAPRADRTVGPGRFEGARRTVEASLELADGVEAAWHGQLDSRLGTGPSRSPADPYTNFHDTTAAGSVPNVGVELGSRG